MFQSQASYLHCTALDPCLSMMTQFLHVATRRLLAILSSHSFTSIMTSFWLPGLWIRPFPPSHHVLGVHKHKNPPVKFALTQFLCKLQDFNSGLQLWLCVPSLFLETRSFPFLVLSLTMYPHFFFLKFTLQV